MLNELHMRSKVNLSWNTTEDMYQALKFISPINNIAFNYFPAYCCEKWLNEHTIYSEMDKKRSRCVTALVNRNLKERLDDAASYSDYLTRSKIIHLCVESEVHEQIARWGCSSPAQFNSLMTSKTPLQYLKKMANSEVIAA